MIQNYSLKYPATILPKLVHIVINIFFVSVGEYLFKIKSTISRILYIGHLILMHTLHD